MLFVFSKMSRGKASEFFESGGEMLRGIETGV
jgi:hypothetical protein